MSAAADASGAAPPPPSREFDELLRALDAIAAERIRDVVKALQPGCLVGGRIGHGLQDFDCLGDNQVPRMMLTRAGESCMTLNQTWGYKAHDHDWADAAEVAGLSNAIPAGAAAGGRYADAQMKAVYL